MNCFESSQTGQITLSRQQLYDPVWPTPLTTLAKKYLISDVGLRKRCKKMNVPLPKAGHWAKVHAGHRVKTPKIPTNYTGDQATTLILREKNGQTTKNIQALTHELAKEIENSNAQFLTVPDRLANPDPLVLAAGETLTQGQPGYYDGLVHTFCEQLTIKVAPGNVKRALCFVDTLIKLLRARGHDIKLAYERTYLVVAEEDIEINFRERLKKANTGGSGESMRFVPTGVLSLNARFGLDSASWKDGKLPLEKQLAKILAKLEIKGKELKKERTEREKYWAAQAEKERMERERKERKEKELSDFKHLLAQARRWRESLMLREYIEAVEQQVMANGTAPETVQTWLAWARKKADWYDPMVQGDDELLEGVDRDGAWETEGKAPNPGPPCLTGHHEKSRPWHPNRNAHWRKKTD